jgi:catechol 2,3-dioxygenase-like lactoylglutathione lyase family enzyme
MIKKLHHVGLGVIDIDSAIREYENLGFSLDAQFDMSEDSIRGAMLYTPDGNSMVELIECNDPQSRLGQKAKNHIGFETDDIDADVKELMGKGLSVSWPKQISATEEFIYLEDSNGNQIELIQIK